MKKLVSVVLALVMVMALTVPALAAPSKVEYNGYDSMQLEVTLSEVISDGTATITDLGNRRTEYPAYTVPVGTVMSSSNPTGNFMYGFAGYTFTSLGEDGEANYNYSGNGSPGPNNTDEAELTLDEACVGAWLVQVVNNNITSGEFVLVVTDGSAPAEPEKPTQPIVPTFSAVETQETVQSDEGEVSLITVKVGSVISAPSPVILYTAEVQDGVYSVVPDDLFEVGNEPLTLMEAHIGLWADMGVVSGHPFFLKVIANNGSAPSAPVEPEKPAEPEKPTEPAKPVEPEKPVVPAAGTYIAKQYDTWGQIALNHYGSYGAWKQLYAANGYKGVKAGMVITLPEKLGNYTRLPAQALAEGEQFYTVKAGDTLGQIAVNVYGNFFKYQAIFERNSDRLKNANMIYEGQILILPARK